MASPKSAWDGVEQTISGSGGSASSFPTHEGPSSPGGPSGPELVPGVVLGQRYLILQLLGQGGMGAVYKAHDRTLGREIALKVIRPDFAANPEVLQRFKQEIILARQVTHRN